MSGNEREEWVAPELLIEKGSDCYIVGNKMKRLLEDESSHTKWEEFRKMVKSETASEECSQLLSQT